ncbi:degenerin mec-10-like [Argiope bruennichi]|uniref:degenerin mec-10-like n=1 Tax=Argiope bruennichi TaxID=94029 RepID=UPI002495469A|nr:degenerin mec-10-like [Argiope bruennichi]
MSQNVTNVLEKGYDLTLNFVDHYYNMDETLRFQKGHLPWIFLEECSFGGKICSPAQLSYFLNLRYGNCITFNKRNPHASSSLRTSETGIGSGLILKLNLESVFYQPITHTVGAKIVVHEPSEYPNPEGDGYIISPGYETLISLKQSVFHRLPAPYQDKCRDYKSEKRTFMMSKNQCIRSCIQQENVAKCGCIDQTLAVMDDLIPCDITNEKQSCCLDEVLDEMSRFGPTCNCPLPCSSVYYNENLSRSILPFDNMTEISDSSRSEPDILDDSESIEYDPIDFETYDSVEEDIDDKNANEINDSKESYNVTCVYNKQHIRINVFYSVLEKQVYKQRPRWRVSELLSYLGNELGIWLGLSLVVIMEFLEKISIFLKNILFAIHAKFDAEQI